VLPHIRLFLRKHFFFFRLGRGRPLHNVRSLYSLSGGRRSLHTVQSFIFRNPLNIPAARFTKSSPRASQSNPSDVLSILKRSFRLMLGFFIRLLPRSCCLRPRSLMPLLHSGHFRSLFSSSRPFWISSATMSWSYLLRSCSLRRTTFALGHPHSGDGKFTLGSTISLGPNFS
jgi:hypothetical protein